MGLRIVIIQILNNYEKNKKIVDLLREKLYYSVWIENAHIVY